MLITTWSVSGSQLGWCLGLGYLKDTNPE